MDDLTGQRFGRLVVIADNGTKRRKVGDLIRTWLCKCDCGNETVVTTDKLKSGHTTSCGCMKGGKPKDDLSGQRFNHLTVVRWLYPEERRNKRNIWLCKCDCGKEVQLPKNKLVAGFTKSCGCMKAERMGNLNKKYRYNDRRLYEVYMAMLERVNKPNSSSYKNYGARGIRVCDEWSGKFGFDVFAEWAYANGYDANAKRGECTIDRKDVDGDYCPENCRWITNKEQANNRRNNVRITYKGETRTIREWSNILNIPYGYLYSRLRMRNINNTLDYVISEYEDCKLKH